ncbi:MAG: CDP-alcohol phosphatidyltransferase family protein, partial [Pirellulales bacterium]|nr:CDP-alcohol phosphatidyltransferase family protein [Pirellulales bacterium]
MTKEGRTSAVKLDFDQKTVDPAQPCMRGWPGRSEALAPVDSLRGRCCAMGRSPRQSDRASIEKASAARHPISRRYIVPAAERVARRLATSWVRPVHLTLAGLAAAGGAVAVLLFWPAAGVWAAALVAASWFFDRADGMLARRQGSASAWGAWLDANVDELVDVALHAGTASAASRLSGSPLPWLLLAAFLGGKYLFFHGLKDQDAAAAATIAPDAPGEVSGFWRRCYHLPGNA